MHIIICTFRKGEKRKKRSELMFAVVSVSFLVMWVIVFERCISRLHIFINFKFYILCYQLVEVSRFHGWYSGVMCVDGMRGLCECVK